MGDEKKGGNSVARALHAVANAHGVPHEGVEFGELKKTLTELGLWDDGKSEYYSKNPHPDEKEYSKRKSNREKYDINALTDEINSNPSNADRILREAIKSGKVNLNLKEGTQAKHIVGTKEYQDAIARGDNPSILYVKDPQKFIVNHAGTGKAVMVKKKGWHQAEMVKSNQIVGFNKNNRYPDDNGLTKMAMIHYSVDGSHMVPYKKRKRGN